MSDSFRCDAICYLQACLPVCFDSFLLRSFPFRLFFWRDYSCWLRCVNNRPFWLKNTLSFHHWCQQCKCHHIACIFNKSKPRWSQYILNHEKRLRISNILYFGLYCVREPDHKSGRPETLRFLETFLVSMLITNFMLTTDFHKNLNLGV